LIIRFGVAAVSGSHSSMRATAQFASTGSLFTPTGYQRSFVMAVPTTTIVTKYATFSFTPDDVNLQPSASSTALAGHEDSRVLQDINKGRIPWGQQFAVQEGCSELPLPLLAAVRKKVKNLR
jgi:hypothetical protein